ncbi:biotin--[acetyl-CoA-carboxylase] ligase [Rhodobacteraceae bacterium CCMM004]|nr:biotin--[acetyl-CoA-carboxylase] ligase [Rhodobacteraceae bacterium CCMM004]
MSTEAVWPEGYDRLILDEVDSTNAEAARLAPDLGRPTWILARRQTAPRGRRGKSWTMPEGNFAATLVMRPTGTPGWAALRSFLAANALFEALALSVDRTRLGLKWPNDVLLDGGKVAGILLESASQNGQVSWLAIGIGINLQSAPRIRDAAFPPVALDGAAGGPEEMLDLLAGYYATEEAILERLGFEPIREKWLRHAARLGEVITARTGRDAVTGRFETVDQDGRLVLATPEGERRIAAADVYFGEGA